MSTVDIPSSRSGVLYHQKHISAKPYDCTRLIIIPLSVGTVDKAIVEPGRAIFLGSYSSVGVQGEGLLCLLE
jgi:hypothetical protein